MVLRECWAIKSHIEKPAFLSAVRSLLNIKKPFRDSLPLQKQDMSILNQHSGDIHQLCASHRAKRLYAFGSILTEKFSNDSDVDLIVDFDPIDIANYADNYFDLKFSL